ncbi:RidA family protein [Nisaea acidiphila]|uniref:RidA family protein n=1 Tax=Nisaea acidiphila TaxID=1862145 RepID=A0A9J7APD4_9PROT|nr:RidA family protein [Nisaea acidiphila]UUX49272.1 RidA family protein [Nisaea acidiphila]
MSSKVLAKLAEMGLSLPPYRGARGNFLPWRRDGDLVFLAGQTCDWGTDITHTGPVIAPGQTPPSAGPHVTVEEGRKAAEVCALNLLYHLQDACGGDLDRVQTVMRLGGFVNCLPGFDSSPEVINGASELLIALYGDAGRHARTAVGVSGLPGNASVEVDAIVEIA